MMMLRYRLHMAVRKFLSALSDIRSTRQTIRMLRKKGFQSRPFYLDGKHVGIQLTNYDSEKR